MARSGPSEHNRAVKPRWPALLGRRRWTLAGRMLAMQLLIVFVVLVGVAAVSLAQSNARFHETEGKRAREVAERLAVTSGVRGAAASNGTALVGQAQSQVEAGRTLSGSTYIVVALRDRRIIVSSDPLPKNSVLRVQATDAFLGRSWVGQDEATGAALAMAPILNENTGATDGVVAVGRQYPSVLANFQEALPNLLTYLGIASLLGVLGSLLLARTVKRQTLGLEPREITGLVEQREALLHGIKEGVLAVDLQRRITMVNDEAAHLLGIPLASAGRALREVDDTGRLLEIFDGPDPATDQILPLHGRVLTLSRMPVRSHGRQIGWVATFRDRTELLELQRELDLTRNTTDTLRAQAHEFSNRMHIVSGLVDLGEYDEVLRYIRQVTADQTELTAGVTARVADPAVAALLIAKSSQAVERGVTFEIEPGSLLPRLDERLATDVSTVLGNLVDNALDAAAGAPDPFVAVEVLERAGAVRIQVRDSGPGVDSAMQHRVFAHGFSTKNSESGDHGIGLALVRVICRKRGGDVTVHNDAGAVFVATLPMLAPVVRT
ncbi:sensor histidine kinase regulating citrate/malate metabolism [Kribbella antiqua]|uniref:Sensor-like histidine kinase SenX3 n=1 Tax=Kribbella antiqua TaxID=2512217 RepID=A0A4R2IJ02_9ACTN|nr:sensor histidine kinase regulating citrate/malate metabolism [Kribbella antiqua]